MRTINKKQTMSVGGNMDNSATVSAGRDLTITANALNNQASGELLAGRNNTINVTYGHRRRVGRSPAATWQSWRA